ncbi:ABCC3 [Cordylochernes scorpioides]|uniref:ABCC3 n=1 Tax=Cordylochernes scorpioides TaxID=51811 RepID=A0ABY6L9F3_9ARAC|nr:ABCC3 [Cordylochernes scorpioides]
MIIMRYYVPTSRQLKRLQSITRSPIYIYFSETLAGASSIQACGASGHFITESHHRIDTNNKLNFSLIVATWLEFMGYAIVFLAAVFAVVGRHSLSAGLAGLSISYALTVRNPQLVTVYDGAQAPWHVDTAAPLPTNWPVKGAVEFDKVEARYRSSLPLVLNRVTFSILPGEKLLLWPQVGVVGRTGAGKSSLTLALFRLLEPAGGVIRVDGMDISSLGLHDLRSRLAILPQNPMLFTGSLRLNLDPLGEYSDSELLQCLEESHLGSFSLDHLVAEGGENLRFCLDVVTAEARDNWCVWRGRYCGVTTAVSWSWTRPQLPLTLRLTPWCRRPYVGSLPGLRSLLWPTVSTLYYSVTVHVIQAMIIMVSSQRYYVPTSRQLKRLQSITRSPIYIYFSETLAGASSIQACGASGHFITESHHRIDTNNKLNFSLIVATWLEFMGYAIVFLAAVFAVVGRHSLSAGLAGLSISYALTILRAEM